MTIKIFLVDDQYLMQEGIKAILKDEAAIEIVGTAQDGQEAIASLTKIKPDIVLLDIEMPRVNGIAVTQYICQHLPETKVIILSSHGGQNYLSQALSAGAASYLLKDSLVEDLKQAIYSLSRGYSYMEAKLLNRAVNRIKANNIVNAQKKTVYKHKYRKYIYSPNPEISSQPHSTTAPISAQGKSSVPSPGINRQSLAPIFESASEIKTAAQLASSLQGRPAVSATNSRQQHRSKQWLWLLLASASCAIVIFIL